MTASVDAGANDRLGAAFAVEERRGLMLASAARSAAVRVVRVWLAHANPERGRAYMRTVGDTTNVTSRLQALTRDLGATIVASGALAAAVEREGADVALLRGRTPRGPHALRGRDAPIDLWTA